MQNANTWMIELVDAEKIDEHCFSIIQLQLEGTYYKLKFGITPDDYQKLRYILTYRPFENTGVGPYRYVQASYQKDGVSKDVSLVSIRIQQAKQQKNFILPLGNHCLANLLWFRDIKNKTLLEPFIVE